jgi:LysM repeat protein
MKRALLTCSLAALLAAPAVPALAADCGTQTVVKRDETLADVATRCDVTVGEITDANPGLVPGEVLPGTEIALPGPLGGGWADRAKGALRSAGEEIQGTAQQAGDKIRDLSGRASEEIRDAADRAGQSVSDYLKDHPELDANLRDVGARVGVPGVEAPLAVGADIAVKPTTAAPGDDLTVSASGLPGGANVEVAAGPEGGTMEPLETATTTASGTLDTTVRVPEDAAEGSSLVIVIETNRVRLTSDPVTVGTK